MTDRCPRCDRVPAEGEEHVAPDGPRVCVSYTAPKPLIPAVDWRERALKAEAERDALRDVAREVTWALAGWESSSPDEQALVERAWRAINGQGGGR
jgi:hypothetical protein